MTLFSHRGTLGPLTAVLDPAIYNVAEFEVGHIDKGDALRVKDHQEDLAHIGELGS